MNILAIIPARGGSKGIPQKNIKLWNGKPLIAYSIESANLSKYIDKVIVSTNEKRIEDISQTYGAEVIRRPEELATDDSPTIETLIHSLNLLKKNNYIPDIVVLLQPTSPLRSAEDIDKAIEIFLNNDCNSVISVCLLKHSPFLTLKIKNGYLNPLFQEKYFKTRRQDLEDLYAPNGAIFISTTKNFKKFRGFYIEKMLPYIMPPERSIDIDTELDFKISEIIGEKNEENKNRK
jgi:CMP-N,N'-diacetyllegionaminic acid synthase